MFGILFYGVITPFGSLMRRFQDATRTRLPLESRALDLLAERARNPLRRWTINSKFGGNAQLFRDMFRFLARRKKYWLLPVIVVLLVMGGLLVLAQGSVLAPFIYTLF